MRKKIRLLAERDDRRFVREPRIIWASSEEPLYVPISDRRIDPDSRRAAFDLVRQVEHRQAGGFVAAVLNRDGTVDLVVAGDAYDFPLIASGAAVRLSALVNSWFTSPDAVLRED